MDRETQRPAGSHATPSHSRPHSKPEEQVDLAAAAAAGVPIIRRFSGGGSVVVDGDTVLVGLSGPAAAVVGEGEGIPGVSPPSLGPRALMAWTEGVYGPVFGPVGPFALRENGEERMEKIKPRARFSFPCLCRLSLTHQALLSLSAFHTKTTSSATSSSEGMRRPFQKGDGCTTRKGGRAEREKGDMEREQRV